MPAFSRRTFLAATLSTAALPLRAKADKAYPNDRPIRLIIPYTPGGGTDTVARAIAAKMTAVSGWNIVVENRPGAGGNIGMDFVANAKPDGLILGMGQTSNLAINPKLMPQMPFDAQTDFSPISLIASLPVVLVVKADSRWQTLADLIKEARTEPGGLKQALAGTGTVGHMAGELLANQANFSVLNVPYRGAAPALNDLIGNNTDYMFATPQATKEMLAGNILRPLAVTSSKRLEILPDVPTVAESGYEGFAAVDWKVLVGPAGMPDDAITAINKVVNQALNDPRTVAMFTAEGSTTLGGSPSEARDYIQAEQKKWADLINKANIRLAS